MVEAVAGRPGTAAALTARMIERGNRDDEGWEGSGDSYVNQVVVENVQWDDGSWEDVIECDVYKGMFTRSTGNITYHCNTSMKERFSCFSVEGTC